MKSPTLAIVHHQAQEPETAAQRAARLHAEARTAATATVGNLGQVMVELINLADQISEGGDIYPPGVRDICRRMAEETAWKAQTLDALMRSR